MTEGRRGAPWLRSAADWQTLVEACTAARTDPCAEAAGKGHLRVFEARDTAAPWLDRGGAGG